MNDLLSPLTLPGGALLKNRLTLAPLTNQQSHDDGTLGADELAWLVRRARGGFGLVSTCAAHVSEGGKGFDGQLGVWGDHQLPGLTQLAEGLRTAGALPLAQLYHGGVRSPSRLTGQQPVSASAFHEDRPRFEAPRAMEEAEIERVIADFVAAARRVARAGFAGVELHGAHGYLLSQFLSRTMNQRSDGWGGALPARARLVRTIARQIRAALPPPFVLEVRLSPEDFGLARGLDLDETVEVACWLAEDGVDIIHVSLWDAFASSQKRPGEHPLPLFRRALPARVLLNAAGKVWTRDDALRLRELGTDLVAVGRAAILDPDWPQHVVAEGQEPVRGPLDRETLAARAIGPAFQEYLSRRFTDLIKERT